MDRGIPSLPPKRRVRIILATTPAIFALAGILASLPAEDRPDPVAIRDLVPPGDALAVQDLSFDARFAGRALKILDSGGRETADALASEPAAIHLLNHARQFNYSVPHDSAAALVRSLLEGETAAGSKAKICRASLEYFSRPMLADVHWVSDVLRYLPEDFRFRGTLFLTFGYDIGVALAPNASLNGAHEHFAGHPRELLYYAIHELHHVGFQSLRPPPRVDAIKTAEDVRRFVEYATQMEGMAVAAAWERRRLEGALGDAGDYVALSDESVMRAEEARYFELYDGLLAEGDPKDADEALARIDRFSSGDRLWYRVGARMAAAIEKEKGRAALVGMIGGDPAEFIAAYRSLKGGRPEFEKGRIIDRVLCAKDAAYSYALYLPSSYSNDEQWPVIFCFDPRAQGRRPVELLQPAAETYGYILAGSLDSKNGPVEPNQRAAKAVWQDVRERFSADPARVYAAGFSGGAEAAVLFPYLVETRAAGIISCGAGLPAGHQPGWVKPAAYYGLIGYWDFRYPDMARLEEPFTASGIVHRIVYFDGWHQWPTSERLGEAVEWLELVAMKSGLKDKDPGFIEAQYQKRLKAAADLETSGRTLAILHEYESLASDFKDLADILKIEEKVLALKGSAEVPRLEKDERAAKEKEISALARIQYIFAAVEQPAPGQTPYRIKDVVRALDLDTWAAVSGRTKDLFLSDAAKRILSQIAILADQRGGRAKAAGDHRLAVLMFELAVRASAGHPMNPGEFYNLACAQAVSGEGKDALKALRQAVEKGFYDLELLETEKDLDSIRKAPQFASLVGELRGRKRNH